MRLKHPHHMHAGNTTPPLSLWTPFPVGVAHFHITLCYTEYWPGSLSPLQIRFSASTEKVYTLSDECGKNRLIVSNSTCLSGGTRRKTLFTSNIITSHFSTVPPGSTGILLPTGNKIPVYRLFSIQQYPSCHLWPQTLHNLWVEAVCYV